MTLFLYGADSYRSKEKLDEITGHYKKIHKSALNLIYLDATKTSFFDFYHRVKTYSMFAETKLVILKNVFSNKKFQEDFLEKVKSLEKVKNVVVIYENSEIDQRLKLCKTLTKECKSQEFVLLDTKNVKIWAVKEFKKNKARINSDALDALVAHVGNDLWRLSNEIKKLRDFRAGALIKKEDVQLLVTPNIETDIFKTIDALAQKNKKQAMALLQKHIDNVDNPLYLLSMIGYQFRNLLVVKELAEKGLMYASIVKKSGLHPFVVKKTYFQCRQFTFEELKNIYRNIFKTDSDIKVGNIKAETALDLFVSQI